MAKVPARESAREAELYMDAPAAAKMLGVSVTTLYAYVGRKGIRSQPVPGSRVRRYWRADIERLASGGGKTGTSQWTPAASRITLATKHGRFYRGRDSIELATHATLEEVAALLWEMDVSEISDSAIKQPAQFSALYPIVAKWPSVDRAAVLFPFLEQADPRSYDLTPAGMRRTGMEVLRWSAATLVGRPQAMATPVHKFIGSALKLSPDWQDLVRRVLVLGADAGVEAATSAVRAVASIGVTPWRIVLTGLVCLSGRWNKFGRIESIGRMLNEIEQGNDPRQPILLRIREGSSLPGFSAYYRDGGDPRVVALLDQMHAMLGKDADLARLTTAISTVREVCQMEPDFSLINYYISRRIGLNPRDSLFHVSRSTGWIAHAMEQYALGEAERISPVRDMVRYSGPLPD
jgi:citrate synthase